MHEQWMSDCMRLSYTVHEMYIMYVYINNFASVEMHCRAGVHDVVVHGHLNACAYVFVSYCTQTCGHL